MPKRHHRPLLKEIRYILFSIAGRFSAVFILLMSILILWFTLGTPSLKLLAPIAEKQLNRAPFIDSTAIEDIRFQLSGWALQPELKLKNTRLFDEKKNLVVDCPEISIQLDFSEMLDQNLVATSIDIQRPKINTAPVAAAMKDDTTTADADSLKVPDEITKHLYLFREFMSADTSLNWIAIENAFISTGDLLGGTTFFVPHFHIDAADSLPQVKFEVVSEYLSQIDMSKLTADIRYSTGDSLALLNISLANINLPRVAEAMPGVPFLSEYVMDINAAGTVLINRDSTYSVLKGSLSGEGESVNHEDMWEKPLPLRNFMVEADFYDNMKAVRLDTALFKFDGLTLRANGVVESFLETPTITLDVQLDSLKITELPDFWPLIFGASDRRWTKESFRDGLITRGDARIRITPDDLAAETLPSEAIVTRLAFEDLALDYFEALPMIKNARGTGYLYAHSIHFNVEHGYSGQSFIDSGKVVLNNIANPEPTTLTVEASLRGPVNDLKETVQNLSEDGSIPLRIQGGMAYTTIDIHFPLGQDFKSDDFEFAAESDVLELYIPDLYSFRLEDGEVSLDLSKETHLNGAGSAVINGIPMKIKWVENVFDSVDRVRKFFVSAPMEPADFDSLSLGFLPTRQGVANMNADISIFNDVTSIEAYFDLENMGMDFKSLGWNKPVGTPAVMHVSALIDSTGDAQIPSLVLRGDDFLVAGTGMQGLGNAPSFTYNIDSVRFGRNKVEVQFDRDKEGIENLSVVGDSIDVVPLLLQLLSPTQGDSAQAPVYGNLAVDSDHAFMMNDIEVIDLTGESVWDSVGIVAANLKGTFTSGGSLRLEISPEGDRRQIIVRSDDAGKTLKALDFYNHAEGGSLYFVTSAPADFSFEEPSDGVFAMENVTVLQPPIIAKILELASFSGLWESVSKEGIEFDTFRAEISLQSGKIIVKDVKFESASMGVTAAGEIDLENKTVFFEGLVVSFTVLNNIVRVIPFFGDFLVGDGIIATNFTAEGAYEDPEVKVQPLSTLSVGFLRTLFKAFE